MNSNLIESVFKNEQEDEFLLSALPVIYVSFGLCLVSWLVTRSYDWFFLEEQNSAAIDGFFAMGFGMVFSSSAFLCWGAKSSSNELRYERNFPLSVTAAVAVGLVAFFVGPEIVKQFPESAPKITFADCCSAGVKTFIYCLITNIIVLIIEKYQTKNTTKKQKLPSL